MDDGESRIPALPAGLWAMKASATSDHATCGAKPPGWATAAAIIAILAVVRFLRYATMPIALVAALAFVLRPIVRWLQRHLRLPKIAGVIVVYVAVLAVGGSIFWCLVGEVGEKAVKAVSEAPQLLTAEIERLFGPQVHAFGQDVGAQDLSERIVETVRDAVAEPEMAMLAGSAVVGGDSPPFIKRFLR